MGWGLILLLLLSPIAGANQFLSQHELLAFGPFGEANAPNREIVLGKKSAGLGGKINTGKLRIGGVWHDMQIPPTWTPAAYPLVYDHEAERWDLVGSVATANGKQRMYVVEGKECLPVSDVYPVGWGIVTDGRARIAWKHQDKYFSAVMQRPDGSTLTQTLGPSHPNCDHINCNVYAYSWTRPTQTGEYVWRVGSSVDAIWQGGPDVAPAQCFIVR
jgi:hypothetical protein